MNFDLKSWLPPAIRKFGGEPGGREDPVRSPLSGVTSEPAAENELTDVPRMPVRPIWLRKLKRRPVMGLFGRRTAGLVMAVAGLAVLAGCAEGHQPVPQGHQPVSGTAQASTVSAGTAP